MTRIKQCESFPQYMLVEAICYHLKQGNKRIRVPRRYMVSDNADGSSMQEYLLTRYINKLDVPMSSILELRKDGSIVEEVCREDRKHEEQMIMAWCTQMGGAECDPQNMI